MKKTTLVLAVAALVGASLSAQAETTVAPAPFYGPTPLTQEQAQAMQKQFQAMMEQRRNAWQQAMEQYRKAAPQVADPYATPFPPMQDLQRQAAEEMTRSGESMQAEMDKMREEVLSQPRTRLSRTDIKQMYQARKQDSEKRIEERRKEFEAARKAADEYFTQAMKSVPAAPVAPFQAPAI